MRGRSYGNPVQGRPVFSTRCTAGRVFSGPPRRAGGRAGRRPSPTIRSRAGAERMHQTRRTRGFHGLTLIYGGIRLDRFPVPRRGPSSG
jgi:hypothetical protein